MMGFAIPEQESGAEVSPLAAMKPGFVKLFCWYLWEICSAAVLFRELFRSFAPFWNYVLLI